MKIYNTLSRSKEDFIPIKEGEVGFYVCGPTVYNHIHIGNARTFISFDMIRRYLEYSGYTVRFVQNITDVDDKIIARAHEEGKSAAEVAEFYAQAFVDAMHAVGVKDPTVRPQATAEIDEMITIITALIEGGHAYEVDGDVYFSVRSFADYGRLSGRNIDELQSGARVEVDPRKRDALDFALWKAAKPGEPAWDCPWGSGRPGWHIECSAMSEKYLGTPFDIHGGGEDLIFPHHENEMAQSVACSGHGFAKYWIHGGMLTIDKEKMSKSVGNFLLLKDVLEHTSVQALRLLMLQTHYRSSFDYSPERLLEADAALERIKNSVGNADWALQNYAAVAVAPNELGDKSVSWCGDLLGCIERTREQFKQHMDDDFNTAGAVSALYELVTALNSSIKDGILSDAHYMAVGEARAALLELLEVLGVDLWPVDEAEDAYPAAVVDLAHELLGYVGADSAEAVEALLEARKAARAEKDWVRADAIRDGLAPLGLVIEDTASGTRVVKK